MLRRSFLLRPPAVATPRPPLSYLVRTYATEPIPTPPKEPQPPEPKAEPQPSPSAAPPPPPPSPPPPPPQRRPRRIFRRLFYSTAALVAAFYAGGTFYALKNDNFHDFFTEFVPGGEDAVLFFEEREFQRRFGAGSTANQRRAVNGNGVGKPDSQVTVGGQSGVSAKAVAGGEKGTKDAEPQARRETEVSAKTGKAVGATEERLGDKDRAMAAPAKPAAKSDQKTPTSKPEASKSSEKGAPEKKPSTPQQPSQSKTLDPVDPLNLPNASDPTIQTTAKILNDLIAVINADSTPSKYSSPIAKAKDDLHSLASSISTYRSSEAAAGEEKLRRQATEFDNAAKALYARVQRDQRDQELQFREEYEAERERLAHTYQDKLAEEIASAARVAEQKLQNELLQQNAKLNEEFTASVRERVETERGARLSKLNELSAAIADLSALTARWGDVVDANLRTQHLVVAVEAVRSALETPEHRPRPFLHELAALKEVAAGNAVIDAAIASIHPSAYQGGVPSPAQLVDRFRRVADEVRKASLLPDDAGVASHAASFVLSKVLFRKDKGGLASGEDVESVLSRTEMLLEEGDLDGAAREVNGLEGWGKVLSRDWLGECRRVLEVRQAVDVMAAEARLQSLMME